jgi:serine/threonine protein kinase/Tol biopolymer transport system component
VSDRLKQIERLFHAALAKSSGARDAFLAEACGDDEALRREVTELLALTADDDFLERPPASASGIELAPGTRLGPYEIEALIGAGGMGEVYRARDTRLHRTVALKLLPSHLRAHPDLRVRFEREARAVAGLNHPNICALYDLGHDGEFDFLVMEYVDGETVADALRRGPLSIDATIRVGTAVAGALAAAHAHGLIHRDVKPSNIIFTREGAPKLVDFGLAMMATAPDTPSAGSDSRVTRTGVFVGTPQYMSPEQVVRQSLDSRTDIFSLGVVLFECLTGKRPFAGDTQSAYLRNLLSAPPRSIRAFRSDVPAGLERLVMRCLEKDAAERQISAFELASGFTHLASDSGFFGVRVPPVGRRTWLTVGLAVAIGLTSWWTLQHWHGSSALKDALNDTPELRPVVQWPGIEWGSRISPTGQFVSFLSTRGGQKRIWVKRLQGDEEPHSIDTPAGELVGHTWSPNSSEIACTVVDSAGAFLHIIPADQGPPRLSVRIGEPGELWSPAAWSGSTVFLLARRRLSAFDLQTKKLKDLTAQWPVTPESVDVRFDGLRVVYQGVSQSDIWISNVDGTRAVQLTNDSFNNRFPIWTGLNAIVFESDRGGQSNLWQMDVNDRNMRQVTFSADSKMAEAASPDGSIITFSQTSGSADLWEADPRTREERQLTLDGRSYYWPSAAASNLIAVQMIKPEHHSARMLELDTNVLFGTYDRSATFRPGGPVIEGFAPRLSADGKFVALLRWMADQKVTNPLMLVEALDTGLLSRVSDRFFMAGFRNDPPFDQNGSAMTWARDQPILYFGARSETGAAEIRSFRAGSGSASDLVTALGTKDVVLNIFESPDGHRLAYDRFTGAQTEIHVVDLDSRTDHVKYSERATWRYALTLKGWRADGSGLIAVRSTRNQDSTCRAEFLQINSNGGGLTGSFRITDRGYSLGARLSTTNGELYLVTVEDARHNISAFSIAEHRLRAVTSNTVPGVTYAGIEVAPDGRLLYTRQQTKQDIWYIRFRR